MRIGILAYRQYPYISANTSIAYILGKYISQNTDRDVVYIGRFQSLSQSGVEEYEGIPIRFFNDKPKDVPSKFQNYARKLFGEGVCYAEEAKKLKQIVKEESLDALICVIAPADDLYIVSKAKLDIPVVVYQLDPFYNVGDTVVAKFKNNFIRIISKSNVAHVFTTDLLYKEYAADSDFKELLGKISVLQFPKLKEPQRLAVQAERNCKATLLYAGSLYRKIRSPGILESLCKILPENARLVFCGGCDNEADIDLLKKAGVECKGYLSQDKLAQEYEKADVLINLGNLVKNQLGSKLIDYIATGKPVLNITQIENCPTVEVLEKYALKLSVEAKGIASAEEAISKFIESSKGQRLAFDEICKLYEEYTPEYVCRCILEKLK